MRRAVVVLTLLVLGPSCDGCGPDRSSAEVASGGAQTTGAQTTGSDSTTSAGRPSGSSTIGDTGSTAGSTGESTAAGGLPDLPPFPEACWKPAPTIIVERAQGPRGPLDFDQAYLVTDWCSGGPVAHLGGVGGNGLDCVLDGPRPLSGVAKCGFGSTDIPDFTAELLEPYDDPDPDDATAGVHLHARVLARGEGWDVAVEIDVPDCGDRACFCPCE